MICPLCSVPNPDFFHLDPTHSYFRCPNCFLIFVTPGKLPTPDQERARYLQHQNDPDNQGYRQFLTSFLQPLKVRIAKTDLGLDYGSGPNPVLAAMLKNEGYQISAFDPFFSDDPNLLQTQYDYLVCVETAEHFHHPNKDWETMVRLVKQNGWIGIRTSMFHDRINFSSWHYKRDFTHVCFYSEQTFAWIAEVFRLTLCVENESTVFFQVG